MNTIEVSEKKRYWDGGNGQKVQWFNGNRIAKLSRWERATFWPRGRVIDYTFCLCDGDILLAVGSGNTAKEAYQAAYRAYRETDGYRESHCKALPYDDGSAGYPKLMW